MNKKRISKRKKPSGFQVRIDSDLNKKAESVSKKFGIFKKDVFTLMAGDTEIVDMKERRGGKKTFLDVTFKKSFLKK